MTERSVIGSSSVCRRMSDSPSTISRRIGVVSVRGGRAGSGVRISSSEIAEPTYEIASTRIANGAPMSCTRPPASPGPPISASDELVASLLLASTTWLTPMSDGTYAGYAASKNAPRQPTRNTTT